MRTETSHVDCKLLFSSRTPKSLLSPSPKHEKVLVGPNQTCLNSQSHVQHEEVFRPFWSGWNRFLYHNHMGLWEKKWIPIIDSCENDNRTVMFLVKMEYTIYPLNIGLFINFSDDLHWNCRAHLYYLHANTIQYSDSPSEDATRYQRHGVRTKISQDISGWFTLVNINVKFVANHETQESALGLCMIYIVIWC